MNTVKKPKQLVISLLDRFLSRNNDINGYWALGMIYKELENTQMPLFRLNILDHSSHPTIKQDYIDQLCSQVENHLETLVKSLSFNSELIESLEFELQFGLDDSTPPKLLEIKRGKVVRVSCKLIYAGYILTSTGYARCAPHSKCDQQRYLDSKN